MSPTEEGDSKKRKRARKEKAPKDPNAPKRPPSAYLLYQNAIRKEIKDKNPTMTYAEVLGEISKMWSGLSAEEKKPYLDATEIAKGEYEKSKAAYEADHTALKSPPVVAAEATPADAPADSSSEDESDVPPPPKPSVVTPLSKPAKADTSIDKKKGKPSLGGKAVAVPPPPPAKVATSDEDDTDTSGSDSESSEEAPPPPKKKAKKETPPPVSTTKKDRKKK
ncbi:SubName: Full=Uncharacterized protein {ECO:0000313/EMBL:CCA73553.1} [Serendipita indica DSM 11827]|nr:SubName: Full=Uncharacterized protein {ECO:0000313/EMBL:CCA73553.1} [Serendipita indica DSM 11827]